MQKKHLYDFPDYYDMAFSFRDIPRESEVFDRCIKQYSLIPVRGVLELGAGTAPHMEEWARRGVEYVGIDMNENMLSCARRKARKLQIPVSLQRADMRSFSFGRTVDFVYIMLGSLFAKTTEDIDSHFSSVARALNPGGPILSRLVRQFSLGGHIRFGSILDHRQRTGKVARQL